MTLIFKENYLEQTIGDINFVELLAIKSNKIVIYYHCNCGTGSMLTCTEFKII